MTAQRVRLRNKRRPEPYDDCRPFFLPHSIHLTLSNERCMGNESYKSARFECFRRCLSSRLRHAHMATPSALVQRVGRQVRPYRTYNMVAGHIWARYRSSTSKRPLTAYLYRHYAWQFHFRGGSKATQPVSYVGQLLRLHAATPRRPRELNFSVKPSFRPPASRPRIRLLSATASVSVHMFTNPGRGRWSS